MRKYLIAFLLMLMLIPLQVGAASSEVTDARWVTRNDASISFVRIVLDLTNPVDAAAAIDKSGLNTTVTLKNTKMKDAPKILNLNPSIAKTATLVQDGSNVTVSVATPNALDVSDVQVFSLKKDTASNKPYRLVIDIKQKNVAPRDYYYGKPRPARQNTSGAVAQSNFRTSGGLSGKIIVIDAGHGGSDPGAIASSGVQEKNVTLPIAMYLKADLEAKGAKVLMTRTTDKDVYGPNASGPNELQARVDVANKNNADAFVSIHINSFTNPSVGGIAAYYYQKTSYDSRLASRIQNQIAGESGFGGDRGIQPGDLYVLRRSSMPATLVELGFISNPTEARLLTQQSVQQDFARRICDGLVAYFGG